jgi:flagellar motor switch protein FliN/FliY
MSSINQEIISRLNAVQNQIWQTVSLTVSEASNVAINFGSALTVSARTADLYADVGSAMLVIQFAFANLPENSQVVLMPSDSFLAFASQLKGEQLTDVDENILSDIRPSLEAVVQGICMAVGNIRNEPMVASGLSIRYQIFSFPPNLQREEELVRTQIAVSGEELNGTALWLLDEETVRGILGLDNVQDEENGNQVFGQLQDGLQFASSHSQVQTMHPYEDAGALEMLMDIPLEISVELGRLKMLVKDVVELGTGSIVEIDKAAGEPVDVLVNGRLVAKGEVVVIEDNFGVRITEILTPQERLAKLGEVA